MSEPLIVIIAFFAALGVVAAVWIVAMMISSPARGSRLYLLCSGLSAAALETDLRRADWLRKAGEFQVMLLLPEEGLPDDLRRLAERHSGTVRLVRTDEVTLLMEEGARAIYEPNA